MVVVPFSEVVLIDVPWRSIRYVEVDVGRVVVFITVLVIETVDV